MPTNRLKKYFLITAGILCLLLGVAGIFLPLLPTTPFFLLAAACFFRSSESLYAWLINHKFFGKRIQYYRVYKAISLRSKLLSLVLLWLTIGYSAFFVVKIFWLKIILFLIAAGVSVHLLSFRTLSKKMIEDAEREKGNNQLPLFSQGWPLGHWAVAALPLQGGVRDFEAFVKLPAGLGDQGVVIISGGFDQVGR